MTTSKVLDILTKCGIAAPFVFVAACIGFAVAVVADNDTLESICGLTALAMLAVVAVGIVAALMSRKWWMAVGGVVALVVSAAIGFVFLIMVGLGQHHPPLSAPVDETALVDWSFFETDSALCAPLGTDLPEGSWWTDGSTYYRIRRQGESYRLEGMTLHEGGMAAALKAVDGELRGALPEEGYTTFGTEGCRVAHVQLASGEVSMEVIVAFDPEDDHRPVAALQRFDGKELNFETNNIRALLEGTYNETGDGRRQWKFFRDGSLIIKEDFNSADPKPQPYTIELNWDTPTNVIRLPDGTRYCLRRSNNVLRVTRAAFDRTEGLWEDSGKLVVELSCSEAADDWCRERLLSEAMFAFIAPRDVQNLLAATADFREPINCLSNCLLFAMDVDLSEEEDGKYVVRMDSLGVAVGVECDIPDDDPALHRQLAEHIGQVMFGGGEGHPEATPPAYADDLEAFIHACVRQRWQMLEAETYAAFPATADEAGEGLTAKEMRAVAAEQEMALSSYDASFTLTDEGDDVVCKSDYTLNVYASAHPTSGFDCVTLKR